MFLALAPQRVFSWGFFMPMDIAKRDYMAGPAQHTDAIAAAATKFTGCAICGGSAVANFVAENHDFIVGLSGIVGMIIAVAGFAWQVWIGRRKP